MADPHHTEPSAAGLTAGVLSADPVAAGELDADAAEAALPWHLSEEPTTLGRALRATGPAAFVAVLLLAALAELQAAVLIVLGPDLAEVLGVSDSTMVVLGVAGSALFAAGAVPVGFLADRRSRPPILGWTAVAFAGGAAVAGLASNAAAVFSSRLLSGSSILGVGPVGNSLLADTYPIGVRGRIAGARAATARGVAALGALAVGILATSSPVEGVWQWTSVVVAIASLAAALVAFRLRDVPRGRREREDLLSGPEALRGDTAESGRAGAGAASMEAAVSRLHHVGTLGSAAVAFCALGFLLIPREVLSGFFLRDEYGLDAAGRGLAALATGAVTACAIPIAGRRFDRLFREDQSRLAPLIGWLVLPGALFVPVQFAMPGPVWFTLAGLPTTVAAASALALSLPLLQQVLPLRLRSLGTAKAGLYVFGVGALGGGLVAAALAGSFGERRAVILLTVPLALVGSVRLVRSDSVPRDLASIAAGIRRQAEAPSGRPAVGPSGAGIGATHGPALEVSGIDVSYGRVQVLFDVSFHVEQGETLALLGTNGGGKSTVLKTVAGLLAPSQGTVRLEGTDITYTSAERRAVAGIQLLPGGHGVFESMTVRENLEMGSFLLRGDRRLQRSRIAGVLDLFPDVANRRDQVAGSMSGGQQQQLALARVLLHEPKVLMIDELSLGLAPVVVAELLETIERIRRERSQTIVVVEQSLDIAMAVAGRAVFMEKGQVRFQGPTAELAGRDDLVRAVFFGRAEP